MWKISMSFDSNVLSYVMYNAYKHIIFTPCCDRKLKHLNTFEESLCYTINIIYLINASTYYLVGATPTF